MDWSRIQSILDREFQEGKIVKVDFRHFIVNVISLTIFPFVGKPIIRFFSKMNEEEFQHFIEERKKVVPKVIMTSIRP